MLTLQEAIYRLETENTKLFNDVFSYRNLNSYDPELDDLETSISGLVGNIFYVFSLSIESVSSQSRFAQSYQVEVKSLRGFKFSITVPSELLLDYLTNAKIVFGKDGGPITITYL